MFNVENWLKVEGRRMGLLGIGYHFVILQDGRHIMARPQDTIGSHTPGFNAYSIGIALEGGRREVPGEDGECILRAADNFTDAQRETLLWLVGYLRGLYGNIKVLGHSECGQHRYHTRGPCPALDMEKLREQLAS
jgi:N-acetyl-anhydromuramyl-L-alanine amidase AmpD